MWTSVIPNKKSVKQHHMVVCNFTAHIPHVSPHLKVTTATAEAATTAGVSADFANHVETVWSVLKEPPDAATKVCGPPKNHQWRPETWWWSEQMDEAVQGKRAWFNAYKARKKGDKTAEAKQAEAAYIDAKRMAKHAIWLAKSEAEKEEFATVSQEGDGIFCIAKQMDHKQGKSEGFDSCYWPSNLAQIWSKSSIFCPLWPWNLMDGLGKQ